MSNTTKLYQLPSGNASLVIPLASSGYFEISSPNFSKNHLMLALAEALTLLHKLNQPVLESHQQPAATVPTVAAVEAQPVFYPSLTCCCPSCSCSTADAEQHSESDYFRVSCSQCGFDADVDALNLCLSFDPDTEFHNLIGFFKILGNVATRDESFQRAFLQNLLNNVHTDVEHIFDATLRMCLDAQLATLDQIAPAHLKAGE